MKMKYLLSLCTLIFCLILWPVFAATTPVVLNPEAYPLAVDQGDAVAVDSRLRTVVAGLKRDGDAVDWVVVRYLEDGSLDVSFGDSGVVMVDIGPYNAENDRIAVVLVDSSDNIYVFGKSESVNDDDIYVVKLNSTGSLDTNFGNNGIGVYDFTSYYDSKQSYKDEVYDAAFDSSGNIVMVGVVDASSIGWWKDFAILKIDSDGNPVSSFGSGGAVIIDIADSIDVGSNSTDTAVGIAIDDQDAVYIRGLSDAASGDTAVAKFTRDGILDINFGDSGVVILSVESIFEWWQ